MLRRLLVIASLVVVPVAAQESGAPPMAPQTPFEQFIGRLDLDSRTQEPAVERIFTASAEEATPVVQQMIQIRQQLVNLEAGGKQAEVPHALEAYITAAARMMDIEARAFGQVNALLKPNQRSKAIQAFDLMAGIFQPAPSSRGGRSGGGRGGALFAVASMAPAVPQRGGRGGGGGGSYVPSRSEMLTNAFTLDKDQKKAVKTLFDDAYKGTAGVRRDLATTRTAVATAVVAAKPQPELDEAVRAYAVQAAAMTAVEMKTLAGLLATLQPPQRANAAAVQTAFFMMRGIFINAKKWDIVPDQRAY